MSLLLVLTVSFGLGLGPAAWATSAMAPSDHGQVVGDLICTLIAWRNRPNPGGFAGFALPDADWWDVLTAFDDDDNWVDIPPIAVDQAVPTAIPNLKDKGCLTLSQRAKQAGGTADNWE